MKQNSILFWKPGSRVTSGELLKVFSTKVYLYLLYYIMALRCYLLHLIKQNCLLQSFPNTLQVKLQILLQFNDIGISLPDFFFRTNLKLDNIMATLTLVKKVMTNLVRQKRLVLIVFRRWFWQTVSLDFFYQGFFPQNLTIHKTAREGKGSMLYSSLRLQSTQKLSDISLQLCMWDDYHVLLIVTLVTFRIPINDIYHLIELPIDWLSNVNFH